MKIVYLTGSTNPKNGWGRYASDLIGGIKNAGHEVLVLKEIDDGYEGLPVLRRGISIFVTALRIRRYVKTCDIIHALDGYPYGVVAALANLRLNKKLVITGLGTYAVAPLYNWRTASLLKWGYARANNVVAISNYTKQEILKKVFLKEIKVISPGIDFEKFHKDKVASSENFILSVGALKFRKGYHVSIPAFAFAKTKIPGLKYKIVGSQRDISYFNYLKKLAGDYGVDKDVEFLTGVSDEELSRLYRSARLFILTSVNQGHHFEGFGLVFLEAAAAGLPVIGTTGNGIVDAIRDGFNGMLVPQNDIPKTAEALAKIVLNEEIAKEFSQNSYDWTKQHSPDKMASEYLRVYERLLSNGPGS
ncbi:MAG: glycosyltransferase family 4 protein [Patescibacteria group bacterium]